METLKVGMNFNIFLGFRDKAGGYAIQGYGSTIVEKIDGNVATVIGLPVFKLTEFLLANCN